MKWQLHQGLWFRIVQHHYLHQCLLPPFLLTTLSFVLLLPSLLPNLSSSSPPGISLSSIVLAAMNLKPFVCSSYTSFYFLLQDYRIVDFVSSLENVLVDCLSMDLLPRVLNWVIIVVVINGGIQWPFIFV